MSSEPALGTDSLASRAEEVLGSLIRFNTVNPPGRRARGAGVPPGAARGRRASSASCSAPSPTDRTCSRGCAARSPGPRSATSATSTRCSRTPPSGRHDPWSGEVIDGYLWGRGAIDMKSQVAAEVVAAASLARAGWRPARGELLIAAVVDEETGGELGAQWLTANHPEKVRCDLLINEGGGEVFDYMGRRCYGVCCAEKGVFRFAVTTDGTAAHASLPTLGDNALLKMGPILDRFAGCEPSYSVCAECEAFLRGARRGPRRRPPPRSRGCALRTRGSRTSSSRCSRSRSRPPAFEHRRRST